MTDIDPALRQTAAEAVAREAGRLALRYYRRRDSLEVSRKGLQDLVSVADREVETRIRQRLGALFPDDGFIGEEHAPVDPRPGHGHWVVDPIDGTWCFLNGIGSWCVSIGYVRDGAIETAVIYDPMAEELFSARKGGGALLDGEPIRVADVSSLTEGSVGVGYSSRQKPELAISAIGRLLDQGGMYQRHGSGALGLAWTAAGRLIGYLEAHMNSWDCVAGLLLIEEAQGFACDFLADDGLRRGNSVLAGPKPLRAALEGLSDPVDAGRTG